MVQFRAENGAFQSRNQLKKVPRLGDKANNVQDSFE
ncbi:MAG: helix-hairpin-helix domain-containing protein [Saprospiraceae bacterium]